jgi:hypothetical protein
MSTDSYRNSKVRDRRLHQRLEIQIPELSTRTFCTFRASCRHCGGRLTSADRRNVLKALSGVHEPPMIILMTISRRPQQRYDHRLRDLVHSTGDVTIATDLGVPRSTARGLVTPLGK